MRRTSHESSWKNISEKLERDVGKRLQLRINDNRTTMLSVRWEPDQTRVSMHRMFLQAPTNVMQELACYLRKEHKQLTPLVKSFIEENLSKLDYSTRVDPKTLTTKGRVYDLEKIYDKVNAKYFDNALDLKITWFGSGRKKYRSRVNFGVYFDQLKLIKINRLLDNPTFPEYVVEFVVYHEMLHAVYPTYVQKDGRRCVHTPEFREMERRFPRFREAERWIKQHHEKVFIS